MEERNAKGQTPTVGSCVSSPSPAWKFPKEGAVMRSYHYIYSVIHAVKRELVSVGGERKSAKAVQKPNDKQVRGVCNIIVCSLQRIRTAFTQKNGKPYVSTTRLIRYQSTAKARNTCTCSSSCCFPLPRPIAGLACLGILLQPDDALLVKYEKVYVLQAVMVCKYYTSPKQK